MKFGSIYYIMSFSARTTNVCIYTCSTRGRMEAAAGIYSEWLLRENTLLPKQTKNGAPLLSLYYRQESLCIFGGLLLSKNEAQARRRRRRSFQGIRGQPCVKDTVVVISDLYIRFRYYLLLPDVSGPSFFLEERKIIHGLISPLFLSKNFGFFNEISLTTQKEL